MTASKLWRTTTRLLAVSNEWEEIIGFQTVVEENNVQKRRTTFNARGTIILCYIRAQTYKWAYLQLPTITADVSGQTGLYKRGNVLFDSGAQITLISMETAESLGLEGRNVSIMIMKVSGEE